MSYIFKDRQRRRWRRVAGTLRAQGGCKSRLRYDSSKMTDIDFLVVPCLTSTGPLRAACLIPGQTPLGRPDAVQGGKRGQRSAIGAILLGGRGLSSYRRFLRSLRSVEMTGLG